MTNRGLKLLLVVTGMLLFLSSLAGGQIIPLSNDTLRVVNVSAAPGDTGVRVDIYIRNTIPLGGWGIRFLYDSLVFTPRASGTSLIFEETSRQDTVPAIANGGSVPQPGVLNYTFAFDGSSCARDVPCPDTSFARHIGVGSGAVIRLIFDVSATAPVGNYNLTIQDDPGAPASFNLFSDTTGVSLYRPILTNGVFTVTTSGPGPGNDPPVIASIPNQSVTEGETLTFNVTATDPEGDNITLQAISLPPNATFPTVTGPSPVNGTFTFAPNLTQGPANLTATFRATDDSGEFTQRSVNIEVLDRPQDVLVVDSTSGGVPGKTEVLVPFILNNIQTVYGFQFDLEYNDSLITIDSFIVDTIRLAGFNVYTNLGDSAGFLTLVAFSLSADSIPTGNGPVLYAAVTIDSSALPGRTLLDIKNGREVISTNPNDPSNPLTTISGNFTIDPFGDLNLDLSVDVADAVNMVRYLLGLITLSARQLDVADVNLDTSIDVGDLVGIINLILGRPIDAPTQYATGLAQVELFYDQLQPGTLEDVELRADFKIAVAGVELVLDYNPSQVRVVAVNRTNRSSDLSLDYRVNNNKVKMLMYSFGGKSIIPGTGSILTIRLAVSPDLDPDEEVYLKISKLVLADTAAVVIPTGDQPVLPIDFKLEQNFPNPFNANTTIRFEIPFNQGGGEVRATLKIYNILGRKVKTLVDEALLPGRHQVIWDGRDDFGNQVASGMYFYRLTLPGYTESKKMTLLK